MEGKKVKVDNSKGSAIEEQFNSITPLWAKISQGVILAVLGLPDVLSVILPQVDPILRDNGIDIPAKYRAGIALLSVFILQFTKKKEK